MQQFARALTGKNLAHICRMVMQIPFQIPIDHRRSGYDNKHTSDVLLITKSTGVPNGKSLKLAVS